MDYVVVKWLHILSATLLFGTGVGSAFSMLLTSMTRDPRAIAVVTRNVVLADWLFTTPAIILQPLSGLYLMHLSGIPLGSPWVAWSFVLYFLAAACWLPVVWIQIRMRRLAEEARRTNAPLAPAYWAFLKAWVLLGIPAFFALVIVFYLMVAKPS